MARDPLGGRRRRGGEAPRPPLRGGRRRRGGVAPQGGPGALRAPLPPLGDAPKGVAG